jgi:flagellar hook assembly protein FlgD
MSNQLSVVSNVKLTIYNVLGQKIKTLVDWFQSVGTHSVVWNATDEKNNPVCSGVYFYSLTSDASTVQKKMMLIR